jgi:hypothetical protein
MNLAQYLMMPVTSLEDRAVTKRTKPTVEAIKVITDMNKLRSGEAKKRYRDAMGDRWVPTKEVNATAFVKSMATADAYPTLLKWTKQGLVERRPAGGELPYSRLRGWEWRWIK